MKSKDPYSGQAPAAMSQMGAGLLEAGANAAKSIQHGYEAMGSGIASGISSLGQAYGNYKSAKTANSIAKLTLDDPEYRKIYGINSDEEAKAVKNQLNQAIDTYGQAGGAQFLKQYLGGRQQYAQTLAQYQQQQKLAETSAETARMVGLSSALAPYALGAKGGAPSADSFLDPNFFSQSQPGGAVGTQDEVAAFQSQVPNGTADDFNAWRQQRMTERAAQAKRANQAFNPYFTP